MGSDTSSYAPSRNGGGSRNGSRSGHSRRNYHQNGPRSQHNLRIDLDSIQEAPATLHRQNSVIAAKKPDVVDRKVKVIGRPNIPNVKKEGEDTEKLLLNGNAPSQHSRASSINSADNKYKRREVSHMRNRKKQNRISQNSENFVKMNKLQEGAVQAEDSDDNETACLVSNEKVQENSKNSNSQNIQETTVIGYSERDVLN